MFKSHYIKCSSCKLTQESSVSVGIELQLSISVLVEFHSSALFHLQVLNVKFTTELIHFSPHRFSEQKLVMPVGQERWNHTSHEAGQCNSCISHMQRQWLLNDGLFRILLVPPCGWSFIASPWGKTTFFFKVIFLSEFITHKITTLQLRNSIKTETNVQQILSQHPPKITATPNKRYLSCQMSHSFSS